MISRSTTRVPSRAEPLMFLGFDILIFHNFNTNSLIILLNTSVVMLLIIANTIKIKLSNEMYCKQVK